MRIICERNLIEHDQKVNIRFVGFDNTFDCRRWGKVMKILKKIDIDWRKAEVNKGIIFGKGGSSKYKIKKKMI